jgi:SAM-dependent methyltransferase
MDAWYDTVVGRETFNLQTALTLRLLKVRRGERVLDVGCGSGRHLEAFRNAGLDVTGLDPSPSMLKLARNRLGDRAGLFPGQAEDLPFEDNEFDLVTLITCLEFVDDPEEALAEAFRVARRRVFIGVLNSFSLTALGRRFKGLVTDSFYNRARFFSVWELSEIIHRLAGPAQVHWATVGVLPPPLASRATSFEALPLVQRTPCGSFLGMVVQLSYTMRTDNLRVDTRLKIRAKTATTAAPTSFGPSPDHRVRSGVGPRPKPGGTP